MTQISDIDLQAFVDGELDPMRRIAVIDHLIKEPQACRQVLLDLKIAETLRASRAVPMSDDDRGVALARSLSARVNRSRLFSARSAFGGAVAAALALAVGLGVAIGFQKPPLYLQEALESRQAATVRLAMRSQIETVGFDSRDIRSATRIRVPELPDGWRIVDAQVFPSDFGPALQLSIATADGGTVSLFATHARAGAPAQPQLTKINDATLVAWETAGNTYVMSGHPAEPETLLDAAHDLADNKFA